MTQAHASDRPEGGIALVAVIAVLAALLLVAVPFSLSMRDHRESAGTFAARARARMGAAGVLAAVKAELVRTDESLDATPEVDTVDEIAPSLDALPFETSNSRGLLWSARVEDEQGKINLNTASPFLMGNVLGVARTTGPVAADADTIPVDDPSAFAPEGGIVWIDGELVHYARAGSDGLSGCERGVSVDWGTFCRALDHRAWTVVLDARAMAVPVLRLLGATEGRARAGLAALTEIKRISELGDWAFTPGEVDRILQIATIRSPHPGGEGFLPPLAVLDPLALYAEDEIGGHRLVVDNPRYLSPGTILEISDGVTRATTIVNRGPRTLPGLDAFLAAGGVIQLRPPQRRGGGGAASVLETATLEDFLDESPGGREARSAWLPLTQIPVFEDETHITVRSECRHPVNVNTATPEVLELLLRNLQIRGSEDWVTADEARDLVARIRKQPVEGNRDLLERILLPAVEEGRLSEEDLEAVYRNALNASDSRLAFATAPFCYRSFGVFSVEATAIVNSDAGLELARETVSEVVRVGPQRVVDWTLDTQLDFEDEIIAGRGSRWLATYPNYVGRYEGANRPPSRYFQHRRAGRFPSELLETEEGQDEGDVRLEPHRSARIVNAHHFDDEPEIDGLRLEGAPYSSPLVRAFETDFGWAAGYLRLWFQAPDGVGDATLFDAGERADRNRVHLFYDSGEGSLKLRLYGADLPDSSLGVPNAVEASFPIAIEPETWYHVLAAWRGTKPGDLTLLVDGRGAGRHRYRTRLAQDFSAGSTSTSLAVEDAEGFPPTGALLLGNEILEYQSRGSNSFRLATDPESSAPLRGRRNTNLVNHESGESVELLGYVDALLGDLEAGGATLASSVGYDDFGVVANQESYLDANGRQRTGLPRAETRIELEAHLGSPNGARFIEAFQSEGYALIWHPTTGREIIRYRRSGGTRLEAERFAVTPRIGRSDARFGNFDFPTDREPKPYVFPISLEASGSSLADAYIDPFTEYLSTNLARSERIQVDGEWFRYDTIDDTGGPEFFLRDHPADLAAAFPAPNITTPGGGGGGGGGMADANLGIQDRPGPTPPGGGPGGQARPRDRRRPQPPGTGGGSGGSGGSGGDPGGAGGGAGQQDSTPGEDWERWLDRLEFRAREGTLDEPHGAGTEVIPCFRVVTRGPGWEDVVTILDAEGQGEQARIRHGARGDGGNGSFYWVAFWDNVSRRYLSTLQPMYLNDLNQNPNANQGGVYDALTLDSRRTTRLLKFPSGELPTTIPPSLEFGAPIDGGGAAPLILDEVEAGSMREIAYLVNLVDGVESVDEEAVDIPLARADGLVGHGVGSGSGIRLWPGDAPRFTALPADGGVLWVGDELVAYRDLEDRGFDPNDGGEYVLKDCLRGILGTEPSRIRHRERCHLLGFLPVTQLDSGVAETSAEFPVRDARDFPPEGYVSLLGDGSAFDEMIGYTLRGPDRLAMPTRPLDELGGGEGEGIFRGRFGTAALAYAAGDLVFSMPHRYWDRAVDESDDSELAYLQISRRLPGAYFLSVDWDERLPRALLDLRVLVRVDARVPWDAEPLGAENGLFLFQDPADGGPPNRIGMQGDLLEIRVFFRYESGAYDPRGVSQAWKDTPWLRSIRVEAIAPITVFDHEEVP